MTMLKNISMAAMVLFANVMMATLSGPALGSEATPQLQVKPAEHFTAASQVKILGATLAGKRMVAVGDHGVVLLSDDNGATFRQAKRVPVSSTLTSVAFADPRRGWAVGHWGAIIRTTDGGENWTLQRSDMKADQPLFSVYFKSSTEGWAVGLWSLMVHTTDGGATWSKLTLSPPGAKKLDRNLYSIFGDRHDNLFIACEQGSVARSTDDGHTWVFVDTGYAGSFWTGVALQDGTLLVGGLRGTVYRSTDGGKTWLRSNTAFRSSVTDMVEMPDKSVVTVGLDGVSSFSKDDGVSFAGKQRTDRTALTAVVEGRDGRTVFFSASGPIHP